MSMFNYKTLSAADSSALLITTQKIAAYASITGVMGIPTEKMFQAVGTLASTTGIYPSDIDVSLPSGWREITPSELHLSKDALDFSGYYHFDSPITGDLPMGPQAKILGQFDSQGQLQKISISFAGTNSLYDTLDYFQMNEGTIAPNMEPLLNAVKAYALENAITGEDVLVTGYSLGGAMTNVMARFKDTLAAGFFSNASYVAHESPLIFEHPDILNMGYENDSVYRITGNEDNMWEAIKAMKFGFVNPNTSFDSSLDNIVLFDDVYASPLWQISPFSVLNIPFGWYAHVDGLVSDAISRIAHSTFYEYTQRDSTVIVDNLSAFKRGYVWVEDKASPSSNHHQTPAFIIGNDYDNLLKGGDAGDYIDAGAGDDKIKTGLGADRIEAGEGIDTLILSGKQADWDVYRMADGTLFLNGTNGQGLKEASHVEKIAFSDEFASEITPHNVTENGLIDHRFKWLTFFNEDKPYSDALEGSAGDDMLLGQKVIFARAGNDILFADSTGGLLHGGEGNDILFGHSGDDTLYGAEGNDTLIAGSGNNQLFGGVGNDNFIFDKTDGNSVIHDFNQYASDKDTISFSRLLFADQDTLANSLSQVDNNVVVEYGEFHLQIQSTSIDEVLAASVIV